MNYPLTFQFKFFAIAQQIWVRDANETLVYYVKQKAFKLKEDVIIYADEAQTKEVLRMKADRIIDWNARYSITTADGQPIGAVKREGMKSLWSSTYGIFDAAGAQLGVIHEENPWIKVADAVVSEVPFVGFIAQRFINPAYLVEVPQGQPRLRLKKQPSFVDRRFILEQQGKLDEGLEQILVPAVLMMCLLERQRG
jgi:uncharacterized protein YxjI